MPVQAPSDLNGEEGSVVTQENPGSALIENSIKKSDIGSQVDVLA